MCVLVHLFSLAHAGMCADICVDLCTDMCIDMCVDMYGHTHVYVCGHVHAHMQTGICMTMRANVHNADMCTDTCMCPGMCINRYAEGCIY